MERATRTVLASIGSVALILSVGLPGTRRARLGAGLGAALVGMAVLGAGMALSDHILQGGSLQLATACGLLTMAAALECPARVVALGLGIPVAEARGAAFLALMVTSFVAAWVAGPDPSRLAG